MTAKYQRRFYIFKEPFRTPHPSKRTQSLLYADFVKSALKNCRCQNGGTNAAPRAMRQSRHRRGRTGGVPAVTGFDGFARRCGGEIGRSSGIIHARALFRCPHHPARARFGDWCVGEGIAHHRSHRSSEPKRRAEHSLNPRRHQNTMPENAH